MVRVFLVTANVGSVYENMEAGLSLWLNEFISAVGSRDPEFVAIHFQETGGKGTENVIESAAIFVRQLVKRMEDIKFRVAEGFVDTQAELEDQFTALSSIYFVHESLRVPVHIWDFQDAKFHDVSVFPTLSAAASTPSSLLHPNIHIGPLLEQTHRKQKEKFPKNFYPNCKWSRKGFLRTRWRFGKTIVDLVNIHLFHDSCNLMAASTFPSPFAQHREKTVKYTLDRIMNDGLEKCPLFIFGDFNFRINAFEVMNILRKDFSDLPESEIVLGTKRFHCPEQELRFKQNYDWLKQFDFESKQFPGILHEQDLNFHPTYPFEEDVTKPDMFMRTRIPAWCDRVLYTSSAKDILEKDFPIDYNLIGSKVCMGDHKPVTLHLKIKTDDRPPSSALNLPSGPLDLSINKKVPNGTTSRLGREFYRKCTNCVSNNGSSPSLVPPPPTPISGQQSPVVVPVLNNACSNSTCPNRLLMMNLTSVIVNNAQNNKHNGLNSSNLSLIQINTNNDIDKNQGISELNENKIPVCWTTNYNSGNNCTECEIMNSKNLKHQKINSSQYNLRGRSASQGSVSIQALKCKCRGGKGMGSKQGQKGGCVTCSKCVIL